MASKASFKKEAVKHVLIWLVLLTAFAPLYLMVVISFKDNGQFIRNPWLPDALSEWHWENWFKAWRLVGTYLANSVVTSVGAVALCLALALPVSYALARYAFPGRRVIYYLLISSMFLPGSVATLVTLFMTLVKLDMVNRLWALAVLGAVGGQVVSVFILKQFIEEIPKELFESAQIDGASHLQQIRHIVLPMSGSVLAMLAIMQFMANWNSLMLPLVIMRDPQLLPVPVGLMMLEGEYVKKYGELMAGYTISSIPLVVLFMFSMRVFVKGLTAGAVKG